MTAGIGPFMMQGMFLRRQHEVSAEFADCLTEKVIRRLSHPRLPLPYGEGNPAPLPPRLPTSRHEGPA